MILPPWFFTAWRPALGWVSVAGSLWAFVLRDIVVLMLYWLSWMDAADIDNIPAYSFAELAALVGLSLGMGAIRMNEKTKGVARNQSDPVSVD